MNIRDRVMLIVGAFLTTIGLAGVSSAQVRFQPFASGFSLPVGFVQDPTDPSIHFVIQQSGRIRVVRSRTVLAQDFLNVSSLISCCGERGLLGLAFAPDYATSRRFYVNYTNPAGHTVIARFLRSVGNPLVADAASRFELKWISLSNSPFIPHNPAFGNHNGGNIAFGPDGYLYIGMGDGGSGDDPFNRAQDPTTLLGKMLRIDVSVPAGDPNGYRVPTDNPFLDGIPITALPEIWSFGLRNPWRFSFDRGVGGTGALVIADVGQVNREEVNYEPQGRGGRNYGWRIREGTRSNVTTLPAAFTPLVDPVLEYDRSVGNVITGGYVYRGTALGPTFRGRYFYTDFGSARLWSANIQVNTMTGDGTVTDIIEHTTEIGGQTAVGLVSAFGQDADGELYAVQYGGTVFKIVPPLDGATTALAVDFNGDSAPDILSQRQVGTASLAFKSGLTFGQVRNLWEMPTPWRIVGTGDVDGDTQPDIVWQGPTGSVTVWTNVMTAPRYLTIYAGASDWQVRAVADMNGDSRPDLVWQSPSGRVVVWFLNGTTFTGGAEIWAFDSVWRVVAARDLNGDNRPDVIWQNAAGSVVAWLMNGTMLVSGATLFNGTSEWRVVSVGDVDGDGRADLIWRAPTGQFGVWLLNGVNVSGGFYLNAIGGDWELSATPRP